MQPGKNFILIWNDWRRAFPPTENFVRANMSARTYSVEGDLDHLCTYLYGLGAAFLEGRTCDFGRMAWEDMGELLRITLELERLPLPEREKKQYREYFTLTRRLLEEIIRSHQEQERQATLVRARDRATFPEQSPQPRLTAS
ncbi:MAG: hypothetical protein ACKV2V_07370 [Blastocatellia bacterium]